MTPWEYSEHFVHYGPNRGRDDLIAGLNKLGQDGWEVVTTKDIIAPQKDPATGAMMMRDGIRAFCKRPSNQNVSHVPPQPSALDIARKAVKAPAA